MADNCISCNQTVATRQQVIQCDGCLKWNHRTCNTGKLIFFYLFDKFFKTILSYFLFYEIPVVPVLTILSSITQQAYREVTRLVADIRWFCLPCQPGSPVAESSRISEQSMDILESSEFNPRAYHSDSLQSTTYNAPAQSTTVSLNVFIREYEARQVPLTLNVIYLHVLSSFLCFPVSGHCGGRTLSSTLDPARDESSISEQTPEPSTGPFPLTFKIIKDCSSKGKPKLIDSRGYSYGVKRRRVNATDWMCTRRPKVNKISFAFDKIY